MGPTEGRGTIVWKGGGVERWVGLEILRKGGEGKLEADERLSKAC